MIRVLMKHPRNIFKLSESVIPSAMINGEFRNFLFEGIIQPKSSRILSFFILRGSNLKEETRSSGGNFLKSSFLDLYLEIRLISLLSSNFFRSWMALEILSIVQLITLVCCSIAVKFWASISSISVCISSMHLSISLCESDTES